MVIRSPTDISLDDSLAFNGLAGQYGAGVTPSFLSAAAPSQALYLQEAGDGAAISVNDLHQGQMGDCFLISAIGEIALHRPTAIASMIHATTAGNESVTLYTAANGQLPGFGTTQFKAVQVSVGNVFPTYSVNNGASQDVVAGQKEIWPQVIEKAAATEDGGYGAITNGGSPVIAMEELTGRTATWMSASSLTLATLQADIAANDLITFDTPGKSGLPYGLVGSHAYMFEKLSGSGSSAMVQLGNPWGFDQPAAIPFAQLAKGVAEVDIGHLA